MYDNQLILLLQEHIKNCIRLNLIQSTFNII